MDLNQQNDASEMTGEEIVISGISGYFPNTENIKGLIDNLYNKVDMVSEVEYAHYKHPELPKYFGPISGLDKFDSQFFRVTRNEAASLDPVARKILEHAYCAMFDAGINPQTLKGTKLGVFIGSSICDSASHSLYDIFKAGGFIISGNGKTMQANRISYWIDGKGPSYAIDQACASFMACLEMAFEKLKAGDCDSAIVGACTYSTNSVLTLNMKKAGFLCLDGKTKCFDKYGDGFVRSDAINLFFVQKAKDAKRMYTEVYHILGKQFCKPDEFLPTRYPKDIESFLKEFYSGTNVSPNSVEFLEANATGIAKADGEEMEAIGRIFGKRAPIKVGSVKSNMGNTQACSGACSLTKLCLAYQKGEIPANLHYNEPQNDIVAVRDGKLQVVTENTKFDRTFTALNNFSFTGANYHLLLKGHYKRKTIDLYKSSLPRLVLVSGRQDKCVDKIINYLETSPIDPEQIALLNNIFKYNIPGHTGRGYTIFDTNEDNQTVSLGKGFEFYSGSARPIWYLYSGMGSQWASMGAQLMRIPIFAAAIERCHKILKAKGLNIVEIITKNDTVIFDNILNSFVGITAVQIGLTDILKALSISPDKIIGHSVGEIGCAYADDCFTAEEAILAAYYRGVASMETKLIKGKMAAVGLGHKKVRELCPPEIDIACQNSSESTTISGPAEVVEKFVEYLTSRSIFARTVASANIAYHSRYIADAGPNILAKMKDTIKTPKARSDKWLSTCFPPDKWDDVTCRYASPEYFTYNLLNTVHFDETAKLIPADAIVIEIAPHGLLQAIMKRSHSSCLNVPLTRRGDNDNALYMLKALGLLYQAGVNPDVSVLYPKVDFPVSTETPVLSHLVEWDHSEQWRNKNHNSFQEKKHSFEYEFNMSIHDDDYSMIKGHVRNGVNVFPEAGVLVIVWQTVAMYRKVEYQKLPIDFKNVKFYNETKIEPEKNLSLLVQIESGSNVFEVTHEGQVIASGSLIIKKEQNTGGSLPVFLDSDCHLSEKDIYKLMSMRGYSYSGKFQSVQCSNIERNKVILKWESDWIAFLDSLIQFNTLVNDHDGVSTVKLIDTLTINVQEHETMKTTYMNQECYCAQFYKDIDIIRCGGVTVKSVAFTETPKLDITVDVLQTRELLLHNKHYNFEIKTAIQVNLQLISDKKSRKFLIKVMQGTGLWFTSMISQIMDNVPSLAIEVETVEKLEEIITHSKVIPDVIIINDALEEIQLLQTLLELHDDVLVMTIESEKNKKNIPKFLKTVTQYDTGNDTAVYLLQKASSTSVFENKLGYCYIPVHTKTEMQNIKLINDSDTFKWVENSSLLSNNTIQVSYAGLSVDDETTKKHLNLSINKYGTDFSGICEGGNRVMGIVSDNSISSAVEADPDLLWPVPQHWTLEEASSVPLPYIQAFYCLKISHKLIRGSTVLITNGDSGFGQAVISICLGYNCTVFTTVSNSVKKVFLERIFPKLQSNNIGYSLDTNFKYMVINATKNKRCDIVIDGSVGKLREAAMDCVGFSSTILYVGENDMEENEQFAMGFVRNAKSFKSIRFSNIFMTENSKERKVLQLLLCEGISQGIVKPLTRVVYPLTEVSRSIKCLASPDISGRVLMNMTPQETSQGDLKCLPRLSLSSNDIYIVVSDGSELGVEFIDHLIKRGARRFLIHMKPKLLNGYFHVKYAMWKKYDVAINFNVDDLHTEAGCDNLLLQGSELGVVDGFFITRDEISEDINNQIEDDNSEYHMIFSRFDSKTQNLKTLRYFGAITLTSQKVCNEKAFSAIERCCFARNDRSLPALVLRYEAHGKITPTLLSKLFNALESSLKLKLTSVLVGDTIKTKNKFVEESSDTKKFDVFFKSISKDLHTASEPIIYMGTYMSHENESEIHHNTEQDYLMILPGFDGNYQTMNRVSERVKTFAVSLQLETDGCQSIPGIAHKLYKLIKMRFDIKSKFYLLGYSFGVNVAFELAGLFEKEGKTGIVFCLDSSPDFLRTQVKTYLSDMSDHELQISLILHIYGVLTEQTSLELSEKLKNIHLWSEKVETFIDIVKKSVSTSHEYLRSVVHAVYRRIILAKEYEPDFKLESQLVLMKGKSTPKLEALEEDYGLGKYSRHPVKVFDIEADHLNAPQDCRVSNIINNMLETELLQEFKKKNLCQYYYEE